jgi:hypothetical protein
MKSTFGQTNTTTTFGKAMFLYEVANKITQPDLNNMFYLCVKGIM